MGWLEEPQLCLIYNEVSDTVGVAPGSQAM